VDALVTPTAPTGAFAQGEKMDDPVTMYLNDVFTVPANMSGIPGLSVPAGLDGSGLPLGLQVLGRPFDEATVFAVGAAIERAAGFSALPALRAAHAEGLVDAVDAFCEGIAFSPAQVARVFDQAHALGLPVKLHAEQLSNLGGAALAARHGALSADHLEYLDEDGVRALAAAGTVAVILPGAFYTLRETQSPPIALLRRHGVPMAVATDCNPGSSPMTSLTLAMNMACTLFRMTPQEALLGTTAHAARALGLTDRGRIAAGQRADLAIWDATHPAELSYRIGATRLHSRIIGGHLDA
jgi:imidazolonepropionase